MKLGLENLIHTTDEDMLVPTMVVTDEMLITANLEYLQVVMASNEIEALGVSVLNTQEKLVSIINTIKTTGISDGLIALIGTEMDSITSAFSEKDVEGTLVTLEAAEEKTNGGIVSVIAKLASIIRQLIKKMKDVWTLMYEKALEYLNNKGPQEWHASVDVVTLPKESPEEIGNMLVKEFTFLLDNMVEVVGSGVLVDTSSRDIFDNKKYDELKTRFTETVDHKKEDMKPVNVKIACQKYVKFLKPVNALLSKIDAQLEKAEHITATAENKDWVTQCKMLLSTVRTRVMSLSSISIDTYKHYLKANSMLKYTTA